MRDENSHFVKAPNLRVQEAIQLVFTKFRETWSIRQTFKWLRDNEVELPVSQARHGKLVVALQKPRLTFVEDVLHNPFYAGAYAWGRRPVEVVWQAGQLRKRQRATLPPEQAKLFLRDHHEGYIDWTTFEENQRRIRRNDFRGESDETAGVARAGKGLLAGLLRCGRCGRKLQVRYWGRAGTTARYLCAGDFRMGGGSYCVVLAVRRWTADSNRRSCACCPPLLLGLHAPRLLPRHQRHLEREVASAAEEGAVRDPGLDSLRLPGRLGFPCLLGLLCLAGLRLGGVSRDVLLVLGLLNFFMSTRTLDLPHGFPAQHRTTGPCSLGTESAQPDPPSNRSLALQ